MAITAADVHHYTPLSRHQDGTTHWDKPEPEHGFNFMCQVRTMRQSQFVPCCCANTAASVAWQLYGSTAENGVWVLPRSHRIGQIDIGALVKQHGDRIPGRQPTQPRLLDESKRASTSLTMTCVGSVPMVCQPGDVVIANRNCLQCV